MNLSTIATAIATACGGLGLRVYDYGPDAPLPPCVYIYPESITYDVTEDGKHDARFVVQILGASIDTKGGQQQLNTFVSPGISGSVAQALRASTNLAGAVDSVRILPMRNYGTRVAATGTTRYWTAEIPVEIYA